MLWLSVLLFCVRASSYIVQTGDVGKDYNPPWMHHSRVHRSVRVSNTMKGRRGRCDPNLVEPVVTFPYQRVEIACSKCLGSSNGATWRFQAYTATNDDKLTEKLMSSLNVKIDVKNSNKLIIKEASKYNSGRYYCKNGASFLGNYDVTYAPHPEFHIVLPGDREYRALPETKSNKTNEVVMYTEWGSWSSCNHCGQPGERVKIGLCYARTRLDVFPGGVPCRSNAVPYKERKKYTYSERKDEKMIGTCSMKCPPKPQQSSTGSLVRTFALSQGVPTMPQLVKRRVYYENIGDDAVLICPEVGVVHGVRWMNGTKVLNQMALLAARSRVQIDHLSRIHIENVLPSDSGNFTCWFENEKIAVVIIKVVESPSINKDAEGNAMYISMVLVFLVVFYIVFGVCRNRKLQTIQ